MYRQYVTDIHGPWRFYLTRHEDETGISGTGRIADGVQFADGTCILRWRTKHQSTGIYASLDELVGIHGHEGRTTVEPIDALPTKAFHHGVANCEQDFCENSAFASIGGLDQRDELKAPDYVEKGDEVEWLRGYEAAARALYGDDWRTCEFGWVPAVTIGGER